jgi:hypothetical protein
MQRISTGLFIALAWMVAFAPLALASDTQVNVPIGAWIDGVADVVTPVIVLAIGGGLIRVAGPIAGPLIGMLGQKRVNQLLDKAIRYAFNAVKGVTPNGGVLSVDVGNEVIARAMNYAIAHAPKLVSTVIGGQDRLREKIIARLDLPADFSTPGVAPASAG